MGTIGDGSDCLVILDTVRDHAAGVHESIGTWLERWQSGGEEAVLRHLLAAVASLVEMTVGRTLRRSGIRDPATHDDAVALVFDHLRRLHATADERHVAAFRIRSPDAVATAAGEAFIVRLSQDRARDAARQFRRRARRCPSFSQLQDDAANAAGTCWCDTCAAADAVPDADDAADRLRAAIEQLEPRQREVILLLIEGKNQAVIAHMVGVCEGTVSRIRRQAIDRLRTLLAAEER